MNFWLRVVGASWYPWVQCIEAVWFQVPTGFFFLKKNFDIVRRTWAGQMCVFGYWFMAMWLWSPKGTNVPHWWMFQNPLS